MSKKTNRTKRTNNLRGILRRRPARRTRRRLTPVGGAAVSALPDAAFSPRMPI